MTFTDLGLPGAFPLPIRSSPHGMVPKLGGPRNTARPNYDRCGADNYIRADVCGYLRPFTHLILCLKVEQTRASHKTA